MSEVLDILLAGTARNVADQPETQEYEVVRLSRVLGHKVVVTLRGISYDQTAELANAVDMDLQVALAGVVAPDLKSTDLAVHYGLLKPGEPWGTHGVTPRQLVKALLLPVEISAISRAVQKLSGYQTVTLKAVKKN